MIKEDSILSTNYAVKNTKTNRPISIQSRSLKLIDSYIYSEDEIVVIGNDQDRHMCKLAQSANKCVLRLAISTATTTSVVLGRN